MPIDLLKYSDIVKQELASGARNPSDVILAWIIAWAYSEPNELLARQITRQLKIEAPPQFQQAFRQILQLLGDPNFKQKAIKAFEMAIHRYKVRESIKTIAFEGPAGPVLMGLKELQQQIPHINVLNRLIQDVEVIVQYKGEVAPQQAQATQQPVPQQPMQQTVPIQQGQTQNVGAQQQYIPQQALPNAPSYQAMPAQQVIPLASPPMAQKSIDQRLGTLEDRFEILEDLAASIDEISGRVKLIEDKFSEMISDLRSEIEALKDFLGTFKQDVITSIKDIIKNELTRYRASGVNLDPEVLLSLKKAMELVGVKLNEQVLKSLAIEERKIPTQKKKGPRPPPGPPPEVPLPIQALGQEEKRGSEEAILPPPPQIPPVTASNQTTTTPLPPPTVPEIPAVESESQQVVSPTLEREVLLVAYGGLRKLTAMLKDYRIGTFRWKLNISSQKGKFVVIIQGAERRLPRRIQEEIINRSEGLLVVEDIMESNVPKLVKFARLMSKLKFIIWGGALVPPDIKNIGIPLIRGYTETLEDLINLIAEAIDKFY